MQDQIQTLLNDVAFEVETLRKANELFSDRLAPSFNIFDYLRTDNDLHHFYQLKTTTLMLNGSTDEN